MSKTKFVAYKERGFWAYDVALDIFLKHLIDAAEASDQKVQPWLSSAISSWRVSCAPDCGLHFEADWSEAQWRTFVTLAEEACAALAARASIPAEEIVRWEPFEGEPLFSRGATEVFTAPVVELGQAIIALVSGQLPEAPEGHLWFYGTPAGRDKIGYRKSSVPPESRWTIFQKKVAVFLRSRK